MVNQSRTTDSASLKGCWHRWTAIVDLFARRRPARRRVDPRTYKLVHRELIDACRALAASADEESRAYYERLEELARPWLSPRTLAHADGEILESLLARCRQVEAELGGQPRFSTALGLASRAILPMSILAGSILLIWASGVDLVTPLDQARGWSDVLWIAVKRTSDLQKLGIVAAMVILVSVYGVSRTAQS